ncbi:MAG: hypothetical protein J0L51_12540 [Rhizobiales bacterium]|nr:hypothetical protein [Hyphomicrobiales bacterium]
MRDNRSQSGPASSLFLPIFIGGAAGWVVPYMLLKSPLTGDRFLDGVIGLLVCCIIGGVIGAIWRGRGK